ncbi:Iron only hydrogenase large subunit C-terminal domain [Pyrenophora tritici-repentis]|uniref:Nuclear architecture-related protein 1 n=2 Tax=Pyrenophora tritici-repentis TaxID=45151 RepID=A0A2W1F7H6_9PLEO|nr:LET1-like protein [Pyrenophora tritici-repentis Pt-1C-BFP]KAA8625391.1 Iron only hydrogenase large subunit C-terminal domain protein [Pyrenophora tritici-repentis]EDU40202.1 LET1-like protein [Pyrenophora tritici-repentis Pt-1C-BFP]KAF7453790.1 Iron only hydrogenase large protein [Pyrenophora tritici-repentis]KAF7576882.1 Iron only hydrogenase large subunit, C-terminal domain protein [Pyrenophora tritici-repentis]KAG9387552.1 Iron only hydrogenase large protein [Pyrenophora tritici-repentis
MSAILSADDLNDFISPGVACIKPIETIPVQQTENANAYEVTTEEKAAASEPPPPASISLTDCLACSGCVTSAEAVLVSLQSHTEVLSTLDTHPSLRAPWLAPSGNNGVVNGNTTNGATNGVKGSHAEGKLFVASVSPQARASLAAVFNVSEAEAGNMISQLLSGPSGLRDGGQQGSDFIWVIDTNAMREACLVAAADEVTKALALEAAKASPKPGSEGAIDITPKAPILTSACPGWICYAEKTHPYVLPHLSRLKSPQALTGTLIKSVLSERYNVPPSQIWHLAIMPCFDKKLEASRGELTSAAWLPSHDSTQEKIRDTDCVITARELLHLAAARGINFASLPRTSLPSADRTPFPDSKLDAFLFPPSRRKNQSALAGPSGGYLYHILQTYQAQNPGSTISVARGRNADVVEYSVVRDSETIIKAARFYGFRNIQNLVRRLKPAKASRLPGGKTGVSRRPGGAGAAIGEGVKNYAYVEVMACPGGCTNGGGQVKVQEVEEVRVYEGIQQANEDAPVPKPGPKEQKEWLARVDDAYFSGTDSEEDEKTNSVEDRGTKPVTTSGQADQDIVDGILRSRIKDVIAHWSSITGVDQQKLIYTSYIKVESNVGKKKQSDMERVAGLAVTVGGGW